jgi:uroporphyrinogen decarboxylase
MATAEVTARVLRELGCKSERELWARLGIDKLIHLGPAHLLAGEDVWQIQNMFRLWHIGTREIPYGEGLGVYEEIVSHPLAQAQTVADIERFEWPEPGIWDTSGMRAKCLAWDGYPVAGACYEPFYLYRYLRGGEQAFEDLALNPKIAQAIIERIYYIHAEVIRRTLEAAGDVIDFAFVAEDLGTQNTLLMSPSSFRRFLKPGMARMIELIHSYGVKVIHHDDGAMRPLLPELIEMGIDILDPVQWRCPGMEREGLARDFGRQLVFHGAVDNQQTLPFGTPDDVRQEVADNIRIFKDGKGYIVCPCHNIQPNTATENILALYEAVHEYGQLN